MEHIARWSIIPRDIRLYITSEYLTAREILNLQIVNKQQQAEQEHAYSHMRFHGFDQHTYHTPSEVRWVVERKRVKLRCLSYQATDCPAGMTSLYKVCEENDIFLSTLLFNIGTCDCNEYSTVDLDNGQAGQRTAFYNACLKGYTEIVQVCLEVKNGRIDVTKPNNNGLCPLQIASRNSQIEVMRLLLHGDAHSRTDINSKDSIESCALIEAIVQNHTESVSFLLSIHNIDVNCCNCDGWTPLIYAAFHGHVDMAKLLLDYRNIVDPTNPTKFVNRVALTHDGWHAHRIALSKQYLQLAFMITEDPVFEAQNSAFMIGM